MKSLLIVTIFVVFTVLDAANTGPSCRREITKYVIQNIVCAEHGLQVQRYATHLAEGKITYDELAKKIATACERANSASCYNDITIPIDGSCNEADSVQHFRNAFKTVLIFNEYMCQNNGQTYLDFVKNGGAECYTNDEKVKCYNGIKSAANLGNLSFKDESVCKVVEADWACLHYYDYCENQNVPVFYQQILLLITEKFGC